MKAIYKQQHLLRMNGHVTCIIIEHKNIWRMQQLSDNIIYAPLTLSYILTKYFSFTFFNLIFMSGHSPSLIAIRYLLATTTKVSITTTVPGPLQVLPSQYCYCHYYPQSLLSIKPLLLVSM